MYHSIIVRRTIKADDEFVARMTFRLTDIKEITIERDAAGIPIKGWLTIDSYCEGDNTVASFTRDHHKAELEQLVMLEEVLHNTPSYFEDLDGNLFPFEQVVCVNKRTASFTMVGGTVIRLQPNKELPTFLDQYRNWMDIYK